MQKKMMFIFLCSCIKITSMIACSCMMQPVDIEKILQYDLIFKGKILEKTIVDNLDNRAPNKNEFVFGARHYQYTFEIKTKYRGAVEGQVLIFSSTQSSACGVNYEIGEEFIIFSYEQGGMHFTGLCAGNIRKKDLKKLDKKLLCEYKTARSFREWKSKAGRIIATGEVQLEKAVGQWQFFSNDGTLKKEGQYEDGKKQGIWKYYRDNEDSAHLLKKLSSEDREKIQNIDNILYRIEIFENGKRIKSEYLFKN